MFNTIKGYIIGDITSFYKEIFLNIPNLDKNLKENQLIDLPYSNKTFENIKSGHVNVNRSSINYSSSKIQTNPTSNILSSSIQVGANDTVRTTRIRIKDEMKKIFFFGQLTNNSIKRIFSDDSNSNCLTKKVLQIEKDRQKIEEY
ncbi:unnamed protein product [Rotaria sp. Silwood1]|nr:unnamed protein product [Rotaria sp. Silwood1]CAF1656389.1 unnamed protein product [Rotaria sp. Silwood1]